MSINDKYDENKRNARIHSNIEQLIKRRKKIQKYFVRIIIFAIMTIFLLSTYMKNNDELSICYKENSNVDYKVFLRENEFFDEEYAKKDNQYIASLIDYIVADFSYDLAIYQDDIKYDYKYRIEAEVNVEEKTTNKSIYNLKDILVQEKKFELVENKNINLRETVNIDYNKYNDLIKRFITIYDLDEALATLTINMYINIEGIDGNFKRQGTDEYIVSLDIPLTKKTVAIDLNTNLIGCEDELIICKTKKTLWKNFLLIILILIEVRYITELCRYITKSRKPEEIYKLELKKILSNYNSYIQKINNGFNMANYEVIMLDSFNDVLEIRDTIQEPILMYELKEKLKTFFIIPAKNRILYVYELFANNESK